MVEPRPFLSAATAERIKGLKRRGLVTALEVMSRVDVTFIRGRDPVGTFPCGIVPERAIAPQFDLVGDAARIAKVTQTLRGDPELTAVRVSDVVTYDTVEGRVLDVRQRSPEVVEVTIQIIRGRTT